MKINHSPLILALLLGALTAATVTSKGQSNVVEFVWTTQEGGGEFTTPTSLALDGEGNIFLTGVFSGVTTKFGNTILTNNNRPRGGNLFVAKYSSSGTMIWITRAEAESDSSGEAIKIDPGGNAFVTGIFQGATRFGSTVLTNPGNGQAFLAKIDGAGRFVWVSRGQSLGASGVIDPRGNGNCWPFGIALDTSTNAYITGWFGNGDVLFGTTNIVSREGGFLAKFDGNGNSLWARQIGSDTYSRSYDVATDSLGNSYVTGSFGSGTSAVLEIGGIFLTNSVPKLTVSFLAKLDPDGNGLWATASGALKSILVTEARGTRVVADALGNVFVIGTFKSSMVLGDTTLTANSTVDSGGYADIFIAKFDRAGKPLWLRQLSDATDDLALGLAVDSSGNSHVTGRLGNRIFIAKYSSNGDLVWLKPVWSDNLNRTRPEFGGFQPSQSSGIAVSTNQNVFVTGRFTGSATFAGNFTSQGAGDLFLGMLSELPAVSVFLDNQWITRSIVEKLGSTMVILQTTYTNGSVFYTKDGTPPTFASLAYSGRFLVTNSTTIRALAFSSDFAKSAQSEPIKIEILPTFKITTLETGGGRIEISPASERYVSGTKIVAHAVSSNGWSLIHWTGDAPGNAESVMLVVNTNKSIGAIFGTPLTTTVSGEGVINVDPPLPLYPYGSTVKFSGIPKPGFYFGAWGNAARGSTNPSSLLITSALPSVAALFAPLGPDQATLITAVNGDGRIIAEPLANVYTRGQTVTLTAAPTGGKQFLLWTGDIMTRTNPMILKLDSSKFVAAHFGIVPHITGPHFNSEGRFTASILSDIGRTVQIESSLDFVSWQSVGVFSNILGTVEFSDSTPNLLYRFYRAALILK